MPPDQVNSVLVSDASTASSEERRVPASGLVQRIMFILGEGQGRWVGALLLLMLVGAAFEALGIGLVVPFVAMLNDPGIIMTHPSLHRAYMASGSTTTAQFLTYSALALLLAFIAKNLYLGMLTYLAQLFLTRRQVSLAEQLLAYYLDRPYAFHLQRNTAQLVNMCVFEVSRVYTGVVLPSFTAVTEAVVLVFIIALLLAVETRITLAALGLVFAVASGLYLAFRGRLRRVGEDRVRHSALMIKWINQGLGSIKETKVAGREEFFVRAYSESSNRYAQASRYFAVLNAVPRLVVEVVAVGALLLVVTVLLMRGDELSKAVPALAMFAVAAVRIMPSLTRLFSAVSSIRFYAPALEPIYRDVVENAAQKRVVADSRRSTPARGATARVTPARLELENIGFSYSGASRRAISGISLVLPEGVSAGFVGASGAGKTTLVDLILGLLVPQSGRILGDGADIREDLATWQRSIGYVPQTIYLLDDTLRRNVALGIPDAQIDEERVREAIRLAQIDDLVAASPEGLDTMVGENGVRLSGGERQRVGIARALYHRPQILVFDEATSALDNVTESEIIATIGRLSGTRTIIQVAHRLTTVRGCDVIYFLDRGGIADSGRFDELLSRSPGFRRLAGEPDAGPERGQA